MWLAAVTSNFQHTLLEYSPNTDLIHFFISALVLLFRCALPTTLCLFYTNLIEVTDLFSFPVQVKRRGYSTDTP